MSDEREARDTSATGHGRENLGGMRTRTLRFAVPPGRYLGWLEAEGRPWNDPHRYDVQNSLVVPLQEALVLHVERDATADLSAIESLDPDALTGLVLAHTTITNGDLSFIQHLRGLRHLNASHTSLTDAGLRHLAELTSLRSLRLI